MLYIFSPIKIDYIRIGLYIVRKRSYSGVVFFTVADGLDWGYTLELSTWGDNILY